MNSEFKLIILLMLVLIISFIATSPILKSGLFNIHDDTQVTRVIVMGRALRNGQFPVRWVADLGYGLGYPIFNFYGPLPYYVGGVLYSLGIDAVFATKVMFFLGAVLPGFAMFVAARQCLGNSSALVASGLYLYAPYHAVQIYVRGAVGEYYALIFFPFLLLAFWYVFENKNAKSFLLGSIGLAGIILSHTILGYVTVLFIILAIIFLTLLSILKKIVISILIGSISIVIGGLAISAFYWLPALTEIGYTNVSSQIGPSSNWSDHFVCPDQLWESTWGYGGSAPGCTGDGMSYQLGKLHIIGGVLAIILWKIKASRINSINSTILLSAVISLAAVFFATSYSAGIWKLIPRFEYVQYPWRFLAVANFGLSLIAASGISLVSNKVFRRILALLFVYRNFWFSRQVIGLAWAISSSTRRAAWIPR